MSDILPFINIATFALVSVKAQYIGIIFKGIHVPDSASCNIGMARGININQIEI